MTAWVLAGLGLITLTACQSLAPQNPSTTTPPPMALPQSPAPSPITAGTASPFSTLATNASAPNVPPRIGSFTVTPTSVESPACGGHSPRPVVTVKIIDPDDPPTTIQVRLTYHLNERYNGETYMSYSPDAAAFRHTLPAITAESVRIGEGGNITFNVYVTDPGKSFTRPQLMSEMVSVPICLGTIKN